MWSVAKCRDVVFSTKVCIISITVNELLLIADTDKVDAICCFALMCECLSYISDRSGHALGYLIYLLVCQAAQAAADVAL